MDAATHESGVNPYVYIAVTQSEELEADELKEEHLSANGYVMKVARGARMSLDFPLRYGQMICKRINFASLLGTKRFWRT